MTDYLPLILIPLIYLLTAMIKPAIQPKLPFNLCAICAAVSSTWLILLVLWLFGTAVSTVTLGILMGMSVTGIMYKSEGLYQKLKIRNFWFVRLIIIVGGFYFVFFLLKKEWSALILLAVTCFFLIILATFLFQRVTHAKAMTELKGKKSIVHKLDNCC